VSGCHEYPTLEKLFFLDESHFEVRRLNRKGAGKVVRVVTLQNYDLGFDFLINSDDFTQIHAFLDLTLVLSVKSNNTAAEFFCMFFETFINTGILKAGDYLILDNAAIHPSSRILSKNSGVAAKPTKSF